MMNDARWLHIIRRHAALEGVQSRLPVPAAERSRFARRRPL